MLRNQLSKMVINIVFTGFSENFDDPIAGTLNIQVPSINFYLAESTEFLIRLDIRYLLKCWDLEY